MSKVLLVDTNFSSVPIYRALESAGHSVHVAGGNPVDCLAKLAANYWQLDYSDTAALAELVATEGFDYLVPGCTDRSYDSCLAVGRGRYPGFDSAEAAAAISNKAQFKRLAERLGLPVPALHAEATGVDSGAIIVKPVDAYSGRGITVLRSADPRAREEAICRARQASPRREYLIEDYVEGQLYSYSAFLRGKRAARSFLVQEDGTANPFVVDTSRVLSDATHNRLITALKENIEMIASDLGLTDGLLHAQFIDDGRNHWLIELTRRCPGDLYSQLIELSTGFPYARCYAAAFLGEEVELTANTVLKPIMRHTISVPRGRHLDHVQFHRALNIERYVSLSLVGDKLEPSPKSRVAIVFCREDNQTLLDTLYRETLLRELYTVS